MLQVKHSVRSGVQQNMIRPQTAGQSNQANDVMTLANMYQRIPGHILYSVQKKAPLNYAILQYPEYEINTAARQKVMQLSHVCSLRDSPVATWTTKQLPFNCTLQAALRSVELENAANKGLGKVKINFGDGVTITFARTNLRDPSSLQCQSMYDPSAAFHKKTDGKSAQTRAKLLKKLEYIADDRGHVRPQTAARSPSPGLKTFKPEVLYKRVPAPTSGKVGYTFTPMSNISFLVRPNSLIPGCRSPIRETNPQAVHYRPRALLKPVGEHFEEEPIDGRNSVSPPRNRPTSTA